MIHTKRLLFATAIALSAADASAFTSSIIPASTVSGGRYFVTSVPGVAEFHTVYNTKEFGSNYPSDNVWSFGYAYFDLTGHTETVEQAILTLNIDQSSGPGKSGASGASVEVFALSASYFDEDGMDDGDFRDYVDQDGVPTYTDGDFMIGEFYTEHAGYPVEATAWYDSQFGTGVSSLGTVSIDGLDHHDSGTIDLTSLVNDWIDGDLENYGFGFILSSPDEMKISFDIGSLEEPSLTPSLSLIPEPNSAMYVGLLVGVFSLSRRHSRHS
ncbi:hypothetical protein QEH59_15615 [Coraliomargarita sp. SDUM461004]|uniref:PEP-CTERM sorting domain-containing protein n=1 Tax=Thalassobacterium sedimentorum TaxID=3041258 RepID=A0ABU1AQ33_9BACT|nr:hypothetical protein [Coraliomargarita sp. SDUM461004]MDQ8195861.1 hypothetical protein [Coraliomargarita sp. SDUM461004]